MKTIAAKTMFQRSLQKHQLRYTSILCDVDCCTFTTLSADKVYGFIPIHKQECVNHVDERMGTALCNLVEKDKSKDRELSTSGRGRLTQGLVKKLTDYYGWAVKSNSNDVPAMEKAIMAAFHHITSSLTMSIVQLESAHGESLMLRQPRENQHLQTSCSFLHIFGQHSCLYTSTFLLGNFWKDASKAELKMPSSHLAV